ncbi:MAG TPA: hypothetical protein VJP86_01075 [Vicinamibacterales bacterium]|jgi:hypothetical protein|nr:hypothetical protein [Vicinamibacterales bacterium]
MRGFLNYVRAAFNARPWGMFVAPNWIGMAAFGLLGVNDPGFWVIGAGLELGYLALLSTNSRFQRVVDAEAGADHADDWRRKVEALLGGLSDSDKRKYEVLSARCRAILDQQTQSAGVTVDAQGAGLSRLLWMYLRLLAARQAIEHVIDAADAGEPLARRLKELEAQLTQPSLSEELRRSLSGQADILRQRIAQQEEAKGKLAFIHAELVRIQEQVELVREQAALSTDPEGLSQRIDQITATLGGTAQWIREQQQVYGAMEDLLTEPPPLGQLTPRERSRVTQ